MSQDERIVEKARRYRRHQPELAWVPATVETKARAYELARLGNNRASCSNRATMARSRRRTTLCRILSPRKLAVSVSCSAAPKGSPRTRSGRPHTTAQKSCHPVHEHDRLTKLGGRGGRATQPRGALCYRNDVQRRAQRDRISINMTLLSQLRFST